MLLKWDCWNIILFWKLKWQSADGRRWRRRKKKNIIPERRRKNNEKKKKMWNTLRFLYRICVLSSFRGCGDERRARGINCWLLKTGIQPVYDIVNREMPQIDPDSLQTVVPLRPHTHQAPYTVYVCLSEHAASLPVHLFYVCICISNSILPFVVFPPVAVQKFSIFFSSAFLFSPLPFRW